MAKDDLIPAEGTIIDKQPNAFFKVQLDNSSHVVLAVISGKMRKHRIRILVGDRVSVEMSPYDLTRGRITYGPVLMEPGGPADPTPRGIFHVAWKAGPHYVSTSFGIPIPYAVFFAPGGIAFHAGSLTTSSHGCVHLSLPSARYYHDHLPEGAEVAVF